VRTATDAPELHEAIPHYRVDGPVERIATHNTRGVARLPVAVD
jgi:hypothetical protein